MNIHDVHKKIYGYDDPFLDLNDGSVRSENVKLYIKGLKSMAYEIIQISEEQAIEMWKSNMWCGSEETIGNWKRLGFIKQSNLDKAVDTLCAEHTLLSRQKIKSILEEIVEEIKNKEKIVFNCDPQCKKCNSILISALWSPHEGINFHCRSCGNDWNIPR